METLLTFFMIALLLTSVIALILTKDILVKIIISGFISFFNALLYIILNALDVAFTEIAIGAGVSSVIFIITLKLTNQYNFYNSIVNTEYNFSKITKNFINILFLVVLLAFALSLVDIPEFGNLNNPTNNSTYKSYIFESYNVYKVPNVVTMVLGSFRGFDTFGETVVILIAALGVYLTLTNKQTKNNTSLSLPKIVFYKNFNYVQTSAILSLMPIVMLFGIYVQLHGDYGPGGGFQAGVIFAIPYILFIILTSSNYYVLFNVNKQLTMLAIGVSIYALTGLLTMVLGGTYLDYYVLSKDLSTSYHYGLLAIEFGVGVTVFSAMLLIISKFYEQLGTSNVNNNQ